MISVTQYNFPLISWLVARGSWAIWGFQGLDEEPQNCPKTPKPQGDQGFWAIGGLLIRPPKSPRSPKTPGQLTLELIKGKLYCVTAARVYICHVHRSFIVLTTYLRLFICSFFSFFPRFFVPSVVVVVVVAVAVVVVVVVVFCWRGLTLFSPGRPS